MRASWQAVGFSIALLGGLAAMGAAFEPEKAAGPGTLAIASEPTGAELLWDGKSIGKTPLNQPVAQGSHRLSFRLEGYAPLEIPVESSTQRVHRRLQPVTASLLIKEPGKAKLSLGPGIPRPLEGKGPWKLPPGRYELTAIRDKVPAKPKRFELKPGESLELALDWPALPSVPTLPTQPSHSAEARPARSFPSYTAPSGYTPPRYNQYRPPAPRPSYRAPEPLFTPIPPSHYEPPPAPAPSYPPGPEPLFTPLP